MQALTLLGITIAILINVLISPGAYEDVRVGFRGLDRISQTSGLDINSFTECDNFILDSKSEENPRYSTLSVRPGETTYFNNLGDPFRGMFHYSNPAGDDFLVAATSTGLYKGTNTTWEVLATGLTDSPWEGNLYTLPGITQLYLCNGWDNNKKFSPFGLTNMQNQDDQTEVGTTYWVNGSLQVTAETAVLGSIEVGAYVNPKTGGQVVDADWYEVVSKDATAVVLATAFTGTTQTATQTVVSANVQNSRYMVEYEGHQVLAHMNLTTEVNVANATGTDYYIIGGGGAMGAAQSFQASKNKIYSVGLRMYRDSGTTGNLVIKLKSSIDSATALATTTYAISNLPTAVSKVTIGLGNVPVTVGATYYITIEQDDRENTRVYVQKGGALANGNAYWTYYGDGFVSGWNTGVTTCETSIKSTSALDNLDTYLIINEKLFFSYDSAYVKTKKSSSGDQIYVGIIKLPIIDFKLLENISNINIQLISSSTPIKSFSFYPIIVAVNISQANAFNRTENPPTAWTTPMCQGLYSDYTNTTEVVVLESTATTEGFSSVGGIITADVTSIIKSEYYNKFGGLKIQHNVTAETLFYSSDFPDSYERLRPKLFYTTTTGSTESGEDLYIDVRSQAADSSTVIYSKRFKPENYPDLNTFDVPGEIVGLAKSGGYLIVATKSPDSLQFLRYTGDTTDGQGIGFVTSIRDITFGSSKSIAYLPTNDSFLFFSGLGVYLQNGLQTTLVSGSIREEAKTFSNYRDPRQFYAGFANYMPQAVILPTKDTYLLAVPNAETKNSYVYAYNYANSDWTRWTNLYPTSMVVRQTGGVEPQLYYGFDTGQAYTQNTSGSITNEATATWFFGGKDLTKDKKLDLVEIWGRADNPLIGCVATLEITAVDVTDEARVLTYAIPANDRTNKMVSMVFYPALSGREFQVKFRQSSTSGAVGIRTIKHKYTVLQGR